MGVHEYCNYLKLRGVSKKYNGQSSPAVEDISFSLNYGEILALLGPSGCGKTTTLRLIAGFEYPNRGNICLSGKTVSGENSFIPPEKRSMGIVFQDYALFPHLTVFDNVRFSIRKNDKNKTERINSILALVGLYDLRKRYPHELSGGQQQRLAVARALAPCPKILLLDEPFSNLDADLREQMRREIRSVLRATETTTILVTHDQEEAFSFADKVGVLNEGRLEQLDTPENIYHTPSTRFIADFVGEADFVPGIIVQPGVVETDLGMFPSYSSLPEKTSVDVMIRPDDVKIRPAVDKVNGEIIERVFKGSINSYAIKLNSGVVLHSDQPSTMIYESHAKVDINLEVEHVVVFPREIDRKNHNKSHSYSPDMELLISGSRSRTAV